MDGEQFHGLANALPEPLLVVGGGGSILDANRAACEFLQIRAEELLGRHLPDLATNSPQRVTTFLRACSRTRARLLDSLSLELNGNSFNCRVEGFLLHPKGDDRPAQIMLRLLPQETTTGKFLLLNERIEQLSREIAARKRAEAQLLEQRELLEVTLASIGDAVIVTDPEGQVTFFNSIAEQLIGWRLEEALGRPLDEVFLIINEYSRKSVESPVGRVMREGQIVGLANHTVLIAKDGRELPIEDSGAPIRDGSGRLRGVVLVFRDVSARRKVEAEREALLQSERAARTEAERAGRIKDEFLATLSHELRTPLNAILGYATLLQMGGSAEVDIHEGLATIAKNARLQARLVEDLLDMNRILSGKVHLEVQIVDVTAVIQAALETVQPSADAKSLRISTILDPQAGIVRGDPNRLQQVVWNLLSNAVKFTPKEGKIQISLQRVRSNIEITVADTGQGIPAEFLPHVFDRFRQADSSSTRHHGGLGLGLSIVKQLVELHGGSIRASSEGPDMGATFVVSLPLAVSHFDEQREAAARESLVAETRQRPPNLSGVRVLVVDDEPDACALVARLLERHEATVDCASSAAEALRLLELNEYSVLISDVGMPDQDGYELIRRVRESDTTQGNAAIPAVALTAFARSEDRRKAALAGFQTHLAKPVEAIELVAVVANLAGRTG